MLNVFGNEAMKLGFPVCQLNSKTSWLVPPLSKLPRQEFGAYLQNLMLDLTITFDGSSIGCMKIHHDSENKLEMLRLTCSNTESGLMLLAFNPFLHRTKISLL